MEGGAVAVMDGAAAPVMEDGTAAAAVMEGDAAAMEGGAAAAAVVMEDGTAAAAVMEGGAAAVLMEGGGWSWSWGDGRRRGDRIRQIFVSSPRLGCGGRVGAAGAVRVGVDADGGIVAKQPRSLKPPPKTHTYYDVAAVTMTWQRLRPPCFWHCF